MFTEVIPPQPSYAEVRRWPRYVINVPVRVVAKKPDKTVIATGRSIELNEGGMGVFAGVELQTGERVEVEFTPPYGMPLRVRATVRNRNGYKYGVEFLLLSREDKMQAEQISQVLQAIALTNETPASK